MNVESISFKAFITEAVSNAEVSELSVENMKFLLDKSIVKLFGVLIGFKVSYKLAPISKGKAFEMTFPKKDKGVLLTALMMITDLEYKIRIKQLSDKMEVCG